MSSVQNIDFVNKKVILSDIAGTTSSILFIRDVLFKYALENVHSFLKSNWNNPKVQEALKILETSCSLSLEEAVTVFKNKTNNNENNEGLKILQSLIFKEGYKQGDLKGHVFADVPDNFKKWSTSFCIAIYSTGNVESQKLIFAYSEKGDLTKYIHCYFDLSTGSKNSSESYKLIAKKLSVLPSEIVFITDSNLEANAANEAGCESVLIIRPGNQPLPDNYNAKYVISSFNDLSFTQT